MGENRYSSFHEQARLAEAVSTLEIEFSDEGYPDPGILEIADHRELAVPRSRRSPEEAGSDQ